MKISLEHWWNVTDRGNRSAGRKTCPSTTLSTAHPTTMICAGRKPNYENTRRRIPDDSGTALTALTVQLACPYKCEGRTVGRLPLHSVALTSELKSSASLSLHPRERSPAARRKSQSERLDKETPVPSQNLPSVTQLVATHYTN